MRDGRLFAAYSCCYDCHALQALCSKWVAVAGGRWKSLPQGKCQFLGIIMPVVISGIVCGTEQTYRAIASRIEADGVRMEDIEEVHAWFGVKEKWGDVEMTRLVQMFYYVVKSL